MTCDRRHKPNKARRFKNKNHNENQITYLKLKIKTNIRIYTNIFNIKLYLKIAYRLLLNFFINAHARTQLRLTHAHSTHAHSFALPARTQRNETITRLDSPPTSDTPTYVILVYAFCDARAVRLTTRTKLANMRTQILITTEQLLKLA